MNEAKNSFSFYWFQSDMFGFSLTWSLILLVWVGTSPLHVKFGPMLSFL